MGELTPFDPNAAAVDYDAILEEAGRTTPPPTHQQMLTAIGIAVADALGPHGEQPELRSRWEIEQDRGRRLQVSGHIDLTMLGRKVAEQTLATVAAYLGVPIRLIPRETFDDL